jgi:hypothetical protein
LRDPRYVLVSAPTSALRRFRDAVQLTLWLDHVGKKDVAHARNGWSTSKFTADFTRECVRRLEHSHARAPGRAKLDRGYLLNLGYQW